MTRSENMKRLWGDPAFRARRSAQAREHMQAINARHWADPQYRAKARERARLWHRARYAEYLSTFPVKQPEDA